MSVNTMPNPPIHVYDKNLYLRDLAYWKDYNYIRPEVVRVIENKRIEGNEAITPRRRFVKLWFQEVLKGVRHLFYEGSLHGVKYIFEPSFSRTEKVTWIIIMIISVAICSANIIELFSQWRSSPFVNVMDSLQTPVWAVPFPSVVLCPHLHVKLSYANMSELNELDQFFASLICPKMSRMNKVMKKQLGSEENVKLQEFLIKASPQCSEVVRGCFWRAIDDQEWVTKECCDTLFRPVFTNYGRCYAFNRLPLNGMSNETIAWQRLFDSRVTTRHLIWNPDGGYPRVFPPDPSMRPYRAMASGEMNGLGIELYLNTSEHQFSCDESSLGYTILITAPTDHLYTSTVLRLPLGRTTTIEVSPVTYRTDSSLRSLSPGRRQCFFQDERILEYYSVYTDSNCKHDLLIRESKRLCQCVLFNWPRKYKTDAICSTERDFQCIIEVNAKVEEQLIYAYYEDSGESHSSKVGAASCYPSCNDILYTSQVYFSNLKVQSHEESNGKTPLGQEITRINVHFYDDMFIGLHRHAQYDVYYFAGAVGGLLSLFLGFSIISVAELIYFITIRPLRLAIHQFYHAH